MFKAVLACAGALACLHILGLLLPPGLTWGFHFLAFFPPYASLLYLAAVSCAVLYAAKGNVEEHAAAAGAFLERHPVRFFIGVNAALAACAFFLHVRVPLLGDSFLVINNFANTLSGAHGFRTTLETFAFLYFYGIAKLLGTATYPGLMWSFQAGEALLLAGFTVNLYYIARGLFHGSTERLLVVALVLSLPTMQLFFGYAESYAMVVYILSLYLLAAVLSLNGKIPFWVVFPAFAVQVAVHLLNAILLPSFLFLTYQEYRKNGLRNILAGLGITAAMLVALLAAVAFDPTRLFSRVAERHYLPLFTADNATDAYALFSVYHAVDLLNLLVLLSPGVLLVFLLAFREKRRKIGEIPLGGFFVLILAPLACFVAVAKFELGMFKDWDVTATYLPVLALSASVLLFRKTRGWNLHAVVLVILVTALHTLMYIALNGSTGPSTRRYRAAIDDRTMARDTRYLALQHLSQYSFTEKDLPTLRELWGEYIAAFPEDWRGYQSLSRALTDLGDRRDSLIPATFQAWMRVDGDSSRGRNAFASFLVDLALDDYRRGRFTEAEAADRRAIALNPAVAAAHNNLGLALSAEGRAVEAVEAFRAAIAVDSNYTPAYINLANAYDNAGNADEAIAFYRAALTRDPGSRDAYENLGITYLRAGRRSEAADALRHAAALGSRTAQEMLRQDPSL